jgi:hypothetical protein
MTERLAATYVTHKGREYLVSTINRPSSAVGDSSSYAETMVWPVDDKRDTTQQESLYQCDDRCGSLRAHCQVVLKIASGQLGFQVEANKEARERKEG